jgi:4-hydroxy-tetrahydrodipicolinate reductase
MTLRLAVLGVGRLGREIVALAADRGVDFVCTFGRDTPASPELLALNRVDVAIDVSVASAVAQNIAACLAVNIPCVVGVTGWQHDEAAVRHSVSVKNGGVLVAPNFSVGAVLFSALVADAAKRFSATLGFDMHLIETHHVMKQDAPSGTARRLAAVVAAARGTDVPITSVRVGHVPGEHTLVIDAPFEQITLKHEARDRRVFADGALLAAHWLQHRKGWFTMDDVVRDVTGAQS